MRFGPGSFQAGLPVLVAAGLRAGRFFGSKTALALAASACLSGCMVGPNYQRPDVKVADKWAEGASPTATQPAEVDLTKWWTTLNYPMLDSLVERAVKSNLSLQIAMDRIREARAQRGVVAADLWPQVGVGTSYAYKGNSRNATPKLGTSAGSGAGGGSASITPGAGGAPPTITLTPGGSGGAVSGGIPLYSRDQSLFQVGFDASWELDVFGGTRRAVEAADAQIGAAEEDSRDVLVSLISEVARNYVEARGFQKRIDVALANIKVQEDTVALTKSLSDAGVANELDLTQARAQLYSTQSQIPLLETAWREAAHRLAVLLGQEPGALLEEMSEVKPIPAVPPQVPVGLPSDLLRRRPDIRRSERQLASATAQIGVATADLFPRFSLNGSVGTQTRDIQHLLDSKSLFWSVGPGMNWPIFDGGRIVSNIEIQNARHVQVFSAYRLTILTALEETENALVGYQQEQIRRKLLADSLADSRRAVELSNELYSRGVSDFLSVLVSQRSAYLTEDQLAESETATADRLIALYKALGGGWNPDESPNRLTSAE
jgi:outer membrane protein, multidrug efflux system